MGKYLHEIRDPIHNFIRVDSNERRVLDSRPFQRLRHIHQLATTFLVYPGATHKRFEHCLGVMELASRVYDVVTHPENVVDSSIRDILPPNESPDHKLWRRALRMAALCHDVGHLPFSHAAESELLPKSWDHERLTADIINSKELKGAWRALSLDSEQVAKLAVGPKKYRKGTFSIWETLLSEIITGDAFGVDRMDYLLRDSHHAGVAYGRFDHYRLIDSLRILPFQKRGPKDTAKASGAHPSGSGTRKARSQGDSASVSHPKLSAGDLEISSEPSLGLHQDGIHGAEALMLARYFMYTQTVLSLG